MANTAMTVSRQELSQLKEFQLHQYSSTDGEPVEYPFAQEFIKTVYHTSKLERMAVSSSDKKTTATANRESSCIQNEYVIQEFPALIAFQQKGYDVQIAWTHCLMSSCFPNSSMKIDQETCQTITTHGINIAYQRYCNLQTRDDQKAGMGNIPIVEEWVTELPRFVGKLIFPWTHSFDIDKAFPLTLCRLQSVTYNHEIRNMIHELIRIRVRPNGSEEWTELDKIQIKDMIAKGMIQGSGNGTLKPPEFWGKYILLSEDGLKYLNCQNYYVYHSRDFVEWTSPNPSGYGTSVIIPVTSSLPLRSVHILAENVSAKERNNYCNYTTDVSDVYSGFNPISKISLKYGESPVYTEMDSLHFDCIFPMLSSVSQADENGYNMIHFGSNNHRVDGDSSFVLNGIYPSISVFLEDTNPYLSIENLRNRPKATTVTGDAFAEILSANDKRTSTESKDGPRFTVYVVGLISRQIHFIRRKNTTGSVEDVGFYVKVDPRNASGELLEKDPISFYTHDN